MLTGQVSLRIAIVELHWATVNARCINRASSASALSISRRDRTSSQRWGWLTGTHNGNDCKFGRLPSKSTKKQQLDCTDLIYVLEVSTFRTDERLVLVHSEPVLYRCFNGDIRGTYVKNFVG